MRRVIAVLFVVVVALVSVTPAAAARQGGSVSPGPKICICLPSPVAS
jgi:hypothetical protein